MSYSNNAGGTSKSIGEQIAALAKNKVVFESAKVDTDVIETGEEKEVELVNYNNETEGFAEENLDELDENLDEMDDLDELDELESMGIDDMDLDEDEEEVQEESNEEELEENDLPEEDEEDSEEKPEYDAMQNEIAFVCIGQGGGNIGDLLAPFGYNVIAINTAESDISTLKNIPPEKTFHIPDSDGCRKDRKLAVKVLSKYYQQILTFLDVNIKEDKVFFIFTCGGGTGSGTGPAITESFIEDHTVVLGTDSEGNEVTEMKKSVGVIAILASDDDTMLARRNTYDCVNKELTKIEGLRNLFLVDNNNKYSNEITNEVLVDLIHSTLEIPVKHHSTSGNIDRAEMSKMWEMPGCSVITKIDGFKVTAEDFKKSLESSIFTQIPTGPDEYYSCAAVSTVGEFDISELSSVFGICDDVYQTRNANTNILMLSGLEVPMERIKDLGRKWKKDYERMKKAKEARMKQQQDLEDLPDLATASVTRRAKVQKQVDVQIEPGKGLQGIKTKTKKPDRRARLAAIANGDSLDD
jgi:hypothetical protein